jgi:hypothetical protein
MLFYLDRWAHTRESADAATTGCRSNFILKVPRYESPTRVAMVSPRARSWSSKWIGRASKLEMGRANQGPSISSLDGPHPQAHRARPLRSKPNPHQKKGSSLRTQWPDLF